MSDNQSLDELLEQARHPGKMPGQPTSGQPASTPPSQPAPPGRRMARTGAAVGGLGCVITALAIGGFIAGIFFIISFAMTSNDAYRNGLAAAQSDPRVIAALGEPIEAGWLVMGSIETSGLSGQADMTVPIHGPEGRGRLFIGARRQNGVWSFYTLAVEVNGSDEVIVLTE